VPYRNRSLGRFNELVLTTPAKAAFYALRAGKTQSKIGRVGPELLINMLISFDRTESDSEDLFNTAIGRRLTFAGTYWGDWI